MAIFLCSSAVRVHDSQSIQEDGCDKGAHQLYLSVFVFHCKHNTFCLTVVFVVVVVFNEHPDLPRHILLSAFKFPCLTAAAANLMPEDGGQQPEDCREQPSGCKAVPFLHFFD